MHLLRKVRILYQTYEPCHEKTCSFAYAKIKMHLAISVAAQPGLCQTRFETPKTGFCHDMAHTIPSHLTKIAPNI